MVDRYVTVAGKKAIHPLSIKQACDEYGLPDKFWGRANSISCPVGMEPGSAWFIVSRVDGDAIAANTLCDIIWTEKTGSAAAVTTTFKNYAPHRFILIGADGDSKAPYLAEFRDKRQVLKLSAVNKEYNVRRTTRQGDSATTDLYYTDSRNSGSDWTWQTMFSDLWGYLPSAIRGTAPTLATSGYVPVNEPENFRFHGNAWDAIGEVLEATQNILCYDPIADSFTVQRIGATQTNLSQAKTILSNQGKRLIDDTPRTDLNLSVAPETIRFFFPKRLELEYSLFDTAANAHLVAPYHTIDKTTSLTGAQAGTVLPYRTNFIAEIDADGTTVNNTGSGTGLDALADELMAKIKDRINLGSESGIVIYGGAVTTIKPGCEVHEMVWRDYGDDMGLVTELIRDPRIGKVKQPPQIQLQPFTGEILVKNTTGSDLAIGSRSVDIMKDLTNTSGQTLTVELMTALKAGKRGAAALLNGTAVASPLET
jgi:hypothetical protein